MGEPLKNYISNEFVESLAKRISKIDKSFDSKLFVARVLNKDWKNKELKQRIRHVSVSLNHHLGGNYPKKIETLRTIAPEYNSLAGFVFPDFVEAHGIDFLDESLDALEYFTEFSTGEFAIRPFIMKYEKQVMQRMLKWSKSKNHHVRRLASEGCRPRLPWGMALPAFKKDPSAVLPILENLKSDDSDYVYRSVANNLNDISKDHPELVISICKKWKNKHPNTEWVIKHACRGLLKKGHSEALGIFGMDHKVSAEVSGLKLVSRKLKIGETLKFSFALKNTDKKEHKFRVEYAIDYIKSNGKHSRKIFQLKSGNLKKNEVIQLKSSQRLTDFTTRKHFPGKHFISILINGKEKLKTDFLLST